MAYLGVMSKKTYLRLKRTNPKLLVCHGCRKELKVGEEVIWAAGAQRKRYDRKCADRYQIVYDIPKDDLNKAEPEEEKKENA
jgi:hypothetical protein